MKQNDIEKRQGMKVAEHSRRLTSFANEVNSKYSIKDSELRPEYQVSIR